MCVCVCVCVLRVGEGGQGGKLTASLALKICDPTMLPTQYPTKVNDEVSVRLVRPATLDGISVHARKRATTQGTVMK